MLSPESLRKIDREAAKYPPGQKQSAVMSALIIAQDEKGWLSTETMDFVDEQHIAGAQVGQDGGQVTGALDGGTRRHFDIDSHLIRHDVGQRGFSQARRTVKQNMIQRLAALTRGGDQDGQILLDLVLPNQIR